MRNVGVIVLSVKRTNMIVLVLGILVAALLVLSPVAFGQSAIILRGLVLEPSGGWVPGAHVRLYSVERVFEQEADQYGKVEFSNPSAG